MKFRNAAIAVGLGLGFAALAGADTASAHAELMSADPAPDSVLEDSPDGILLTFSESVEIVDDSIELVDSSGDRVDTGPVNQDRGADTLAVEIDTELDGSYVVSWRALSLDSHTIGGAYTFAVGLRTDLEANLVDDITTASAPDSAAEVWVGIGRTLSYAGTALLVGGFLVPSWCDRTLLTTRRARRMLVAAATVGAVGTAVMIAAQASLVGGGALSLDAWSDVIQSRSGRWWAARLTTFVAAVPLLVVGSRQLATRGARVVGIAVSTCLLMVIAAGGHAVTGRAQVPAFVVTVLHLAAMSVWVGGLAMITLAGRGSRRAPLVRFGPLALGSIVVLALTGTFNAWRQLGGLDRLTSSSYGRWLVIKLAIVAVVIVVAVVNRRRVRHRDLPLSGPLAVEVAGMVAVLAATAGLVGSAPPYGTPVESPVPVSVTAANGAVRARIDLFPAATGGTEMSVGLFSPGAPLETADEITVTASLPAEQLGPIDIPVDELGPNVVTTTDADFPLPGVWEISVTARFGEFDQLVLTESVEIRSR